MNTTLKSVLKISLPLLLGAFLVWYSVSKISVGILLGYFKNADYFWIGLGVFFGLLSHLSRAYRWKFMIEPMGYQLRLPNSIMAVFITYLVNYTIPRAGEVSRATILTNYEGVPFEKGFGTIIAERVADLLVMLCIISLSLVLEFDIIYKYLAMALDPTKLIIFGLVGILIPVVGYQLFKTSNHPFVLKIKSLLLGLVEGISSILKMKKKWAFLAHTLFIWVMYVLMFYVTSFSLVETSQLPFSAILIGFIFASFSIAATNGGIGSYPLAIYAAFSIFNIPEDPSIAFGWIMWTSQTVMIIILGGLSLLFLPIYNKVYPKQTSK
ncbi:flippase-like domain-containing protein [Flavobacteriaceae bacterium]|nr:flippase-like domain-containing protein [Flavobacteriaceae bacterium]